jgi:single-stranded DNA-binding protein
MQGIAAAATGKIVGSAPTRKYTSTGKSLLSFTLLADGREGDEPAYLRVTAWNELADQLAEQVSVGSLLYVEGRARVSLWRPAGPDGTPGEPRVNLELSAWRVEVLAAFRQRRPEPSRRRDSRDERMSVVLAAAPDAAREAELRRALDLD